MITKNANLNEIGNSINSINLEYAEIDKYTKLGTSGNQEVFLSKIKFYYERETALIAIQYILQSKENREKKDPSTFIYSEQSYFGPQMSTKINSKKNNPIDAIILSLGADEAIYLIQGSFNEITNQITRMNIYTTKGQFVEFGPSESTINFKWEYHYSLKAFDGFIIGWNNKSINYLAGIEHIIESKPEAKEELRDATYDNVIAIQPLYQTMLYGNPSSDTILEDYFTQGDLLNDLREKNLYLSQVTICYSKGINGIELEYTETGNQSKRKKIAYKGRKFESTDKTSSITLTQDDCISQFTIHYSQNLEGIILQSFQGKKIQCITQNSSDNTVEFKENSTTSSVCLLGIVAGYSERINCIQFYYKKKAV